MLSSRQINVFQELMLGNYIYDVEINQNEFKKYLAMKKAWPLSVTGFKFSYLFEKYLADIKFYENKDFIFNIINAIDKLIENCEDLKLFIPSPEKTTAWPYENFSLLALATKATNINTISDIEIKCSLIKLLDRIRQKSLSVPITIGKFLEESFLKTLLDKNHLETLKSAFWFLQEESQRKAFEYALSTVHVPGILTIMDYDLATKKERRLNRLKRIGAWPGILSINESFYQKKLDEKQIDKLKLTALADEIASTFPMQDGATVFDFIFPFSNEDGYKKLFNELLTIKRLKQKGIINFMETDELEVGLVFGESHFLSMLPRLSECINLLVLADIEPRQHKNIRHMLESFNQAESPDEFINYYLSNNPILNERVGTKDNPKQFANSEYLNRMVRNPRGLGEFFFLNSSEQFAECKTAIKKLSIVQINFNLLNSESCDQLAKLLERHHANMRFCNFTNIHHYDDQSRLSLSVPKLLRDPENCLIMYATGRQDDLHTKISKGLTSYFKSCLNKPYQPAYQNDVEIQSDLFLIQNAIKHRKIC